jgi:DNA-directed RNA polymerase subunit RPC12/RpoP
MTPKRTLLVYYAIWVVFGLVLLGLTVYVNSLFLMPLVVLMVVLGSLSIMIKCPHCGRRIMIRKMELSGMPLGVRGWPPRRCPDCGKPIL